ncbi:expressed protein [Chlorella variabilis]|uniref:Expressed protein n=1 Tax=Chlorella variabilis TaxID=554065 RepID=E1ZBN5_CHLVA|nr:expressed protein [Chlorella variabilis]EFN56887.1 expressed protein [Chlorella variabilis]|eukprot:XP_005848989.1 expressed protein [Chlorella variabilis]
MHAGDRLLVAEHYQELILPVLRWAAGTTTACATHLVSFSRPCSLPVRQREEAVRHACRLAALHPPDSRARRACCEVIWVLVVDQPAFGPLPAGAELPAGASCGGGEQPPPAVIAASRFEATPHQAYNSWTLVTLLACLCGTLKLGSGDASALRRLEACIAGSSPLARRLVQLLDGADEEQQAQMVRLLYPLLPPDSEEASLMSLSLMRAGAAPVMERLVGHACFAPGGRNAALAKWLRSLLEEVRMFEATERMMMGRLPDPDAASGSSPAAGAAAAGAAGACRLRFLQRLEAAGSGPLRAALAELGVDASEGLDSRCLAGLLITAANAPGPDGGARVGTVVAKLLMPQMQQAVQQELRAAVEQPGGGVADPGLVATMARLSAALDCRDPAGGEADGRGRRCAACGASRGEGARLQRCSCRLVSYCDEACQHQHWQTHKAACKAARRARAAA